MSRLSQRAARVVRIRSIEHRVAAVRQAAAERRIAELLGIASRLSSLRSGLRTSEGATDGQSLKAMSEMLLRLRRAEGDLARPISQAEAHHQHAFAARLAARSREDGAERLRGKAAEAEDGIAALREDSSRVVRKTSRRRP
jgi:hypothetical protein